MIICGFPGTGKSMMARNSGWVDLESTPFEKDWFRYATVAKHMSDNGYTVMVSTHEEMLDSLEHLEAHYFVIVPPVSDKHIYLRRYRMRGNSDGFIRLLDYNWSDWIDKLITKPSVLKSTIILPSDGCIAGLSDSLMRQRRQ